MATPTASSQAHRSVFYIRRFEDGKLTREDMLTKQDMRAIFKDVWQTKPKASPPSIALP